MWTSPPAVFCITTFWNYQTNDIVLWNCAGFSSCHLIVHPISLLMPLILISSLMLLCSLLPHQLSPLIRHHSFPGFWVSFGLSRLVDSVGTAIRDLMPSCILKVSTSSLLNWVTYWPVLLVPSIEPLCVTTIWANTCHHCLTSGSPQGFL